MSDASPDPLLHRAQPLIAAAVRAIVQENALPPSAAGGIDRHLRTLRLEAGDALRSQPARLVRAFESALSELIAECAAAMPMTPALSIDELELMDAEQTREQIDLAHIASAHMHELARQWQPVQARLQPASISLAHGPGASPISPEGLTQALWRGSEQLPLSPGARVELVRQVMAALAPRLAALYSELAPAAQSADAPHGKLPTTADTELALVPLEGEALAADAVEFDVTRPGALRELLPLLPAQRGAAPVAPRVAPVAAHAPPGVAVGGQQASHRSQRHQHRTATDSVDDDAVVRLVRRHREELSGLPADAEPWQVMELIERIFDQIGVQHRLPEMAQVLVAQLQDLVVRVALQDATLLDTHRHPAWVFTNRLISQLRLQATTDPGQMEVFLRWVSGWFSRWQAMPSTAELEAATQRVVQWQRLQATRRLTDVEPALNLLRLNAWLEPRVDALRPTLEATLAGYAPHDTVRRFVMDIWVLVVAHQQAQGQSGSEAQACLGDLLWSTDAARCRGDRPALMAMLPGLARCLEQGMQTIGVDESRRHAWMDRLAALHKLVMQRERPAAPPVAAPARPQTQAAPAATAAPEFAAPIAAPAQVTAPTVTPAVKPTAPPQATPAATSLAQPAVTTATDTPPTAGQPTSPGPAAADANAPEPASDLLTRLQVGDALRLQLQGQWCVSQLLWMSDNGHFLLFSGAASGVSHSFTRRALERLQREGLIQPLPDAQVLQQAAQGVRRRQ